MMARSINPPCKGRIQKRKTNRLQIIKSSLQRTAGPYKSARTSLTHSQGRFLEHLIAAAEGLKLTAVRS